MKKPRILVATDLGTNSLRAEREARSLAREMGAEVDLLHVLLEGTHPVLQSAFAAPGASRELAGLFSKIKSDAERTIRKKVAEFQKAGVRCSARVEVTFISAEDAILREARRNGSRLIVMGTHGRGNIGEMVFGHTARDVIRRSPVPVVTVRSRR